MSIGTLLRYLVGNRQAILQIASTRNGLILGILFVMSAGLAREYDSRDLIHEPAYLFAPLVASVATSFLLFCLITFVGTGKNDINLPFWSTYRQFLALYWMTAPLAWFYAIPVDRVLTTERATAANLALLGVVSLWRVILMTRVVSVFFGTRTIVAFWMVMFFADTLALTILKFTPLPIFNFMGGVPMSQSEQMIQEAAIYVGCFGVLSWLVWFIGVMVIGLTGRRWTPPKIDFGVSHVAFPLWSLTGLVFLALAAALPLPQSEQRLRYQVEYGLTHGRIAEALTTMSKHVPGDFPPHWVPPPWIAYHKQRPRVVDVVDVTLNLPTAPWVREIFVQKLLAQTTDSWRARYHWPLLPATEKDQILGIFGHIGLTKENAEYLKEAMASESEETRKERMRTLLNAAGYETKKAAGDATAKLTEPKEPAAKNSADSGD